VARGSANGKVPDTIVATGQTSKTLSAPNQMNTTPNRMRRAGRVAGRTASAGPSMVATRRCAPRLPDFQVVRGVVEMVTCFLRVVRSSIPARRG
jgi:hypothetical protein